MVSAPPAMMMSAPPERMRSAAMAIACRPELQKRLMVTPVTVSGSPARRATQRAILLPDSASGMAQPRMMSSISSFGTCGYFSKRRLMTAPARSSGREVRNAPRGAKKKKKKKNTKKQTTTQQNKQKHKHHQQQTNKQNTKPHPTKQPTTTTNPPHFPSSSFF